MNVMYMLDRCMDTQSVKIALKLLLDYTLTSSCDCIGNCLTFETGCDTPIRHVRVNQKPLRGCHTKSIEPEEIPVHC